MNIINMKITDIHPHEKNPRFNDDAVEKVAASIKEYGWRAPIVVDKDHIIVAGHTRYKAAQFLGLAEVPVHVADNLTPEQVQAYRIADNKTGEIAQWNYDLLPLEIKELQAANFDLSLLGFDTDELDRLLNGPEEDAITEGETDPDAVPEVPEEAVSKLGEIYQFGDHRLMCGDATNADDVAELMGDTQANLLVTDPPYNVALEGSNGLTIMNDNMEDSAFRKFLTESLKCTADVLAPGMSFYVFHADSEAYNFRGACKDANLPVHETLYWVKNSLVLGRLDYHYKSEPCQPAGTIVWTEKNNRLPIEDLHDGDKVMSFARVGGEILGYKHTGFSVKTANRDYKGELYGVRVGNKITWTTPEHRFGVRFKSEAKDFWCTYLMKRGRLWRIGMCRIFNQLGHGLKIRLKQEKADAAWILGVFSNHNDASSAEHAAAVRYGIPMTHWETDRWKKLGENWRDKAHIQQIYLRLDLNEVERNAMKLLNLYHRLYEFPCITRALCREKYSRRVISLIPACNLIPEIMEIPIPYEQWDTAKNKTYSWQSITTIEHKEYDGKVYSLDVDKLHFYIADGILTHNCLYGWKPGAAHRWFSDRCQTNIMEFDKPRCNAEHPSMKPIPMLIYLIKNSSQRGELVVDTFGGSGSTLIACEQTGRKCRTMELDPKYCDVIRRRWAEFVHGEGCDWKALTPPMEQETTVEE